MDIKCRIICETCGGTGKNQLSYIEAFYIVEEQRRQFPGGVLMPGQVGPESIDAKIQRLQQCPDCTDGYNYFWKEIDDSVIQNLGDNV